MPIALVFSLPTWRTAFATASARRAFSAFTLAGGIWYSTTCRSPASRTWAGPMATPGATPRPSSTISSLPFLVFLSVFIELVGHQLRQRVHRLLRLRSGRLDPDVATRPRRQHHEPHDRAAGHPGLVLLDGNLRVEGFCQLDELRGRARVQALLVADGHHPPHHRRRGSGRIVDMSGHGDSVSPSPHPAAGKRR